MADCIRLLPEVVANQIAAGEVVNRPASVVKEMMENAIDAGARSVKVNFRDGGKELIQIVDDGCGMSPIDARLAFDRHATSKICSVEDIYALSTFGFRGEALASIAAVAQVELRTRQADAEMGTVTEIHGGEFISQQPTLCPVGSQFYVRNLFYNLPARRRFLEKRSTSAAQIKSEFQRVALCNPQVSFELYANDAILYQLPANTLAGRIVEVVGRHIKQNLLEVGADTSLAKVEGYIGRPAAAKRRNGEQYLFVNGRYFKSPYLTSAILRAYEKLISPQTQPSFFLYLTIEPARVDVNVHPQKTEVKFADEEAIWQILHAAVRESLAKTGAVPMMDFEMSPTVEIPVMEPGARYREPKAMSNADYNPFRESYIDPTAPDATEDFTGFDAPYDGGEQRLSDIPSAGFSAGGGLHSARPSFLAGGEFAWESEEGFREIASGEESLYEDIPSGGYPSAVGASSLDFVSDEPEGEQQRLEVGSQLKFTDPKPLVGGLVVACVEGRLVVVDCARARERICYEEYLRLLAQGASVSQQLLFPEALLLSSDEYALLEEHAVELAALGFDLTFDGGGAITVKGTPADLAVESIDQLLYELLQAFSLPLSVEQVRREKVAGVMARAAARGFARRLTAEEAEALLAQLVATAEYSFTPSGKAIFAELTTEDLRTKLG